VSQHQLIELRPREGGEEVTLYVKGFLGRGEEPDHFDRWLGAHEALEQSHGWGPDVVACRWPAGELLPRSLAAMGAVKGAVDVFRIVRNVRRAARLAHWGAMAAEELAFLTAHFVYQYVAATRSAAERAADLALHLEELAAEHRRVRVVAHSLGCRHVIEGISLLSESKRPAEVHLCAPACREQDVAEKLEGLARERTWLYYTRADRVLDLAFTPIAMGRAMGSVGLEAPPAGLETLDVSEHFDFWVHGEYARRFDRLVAAQGRDEVEFRRRPTR
jgi:hypothetical protein